jgi:SPRY domain-containing SOCS box protein 1/4
VRWSSRHRGTHAVVGVGTRDAPLHCTGYRSLVGSNADSWGWDICRNRLLHAAAHADDTPTQRRLQCDSDSPVELIVVDMDEGTLGFATVDGSYLGTAFRGLRSKKPLYPIISAVWGHCEVTMRYLGGRNREYFRVVLRVFSMMTCNVG